MGSDSSNNLCGLVWSLVGVVSRCFVVLLGVFSPGVLIDVQ